MNKKIIFIVLCIVLAFVIAVAAAFYNKFSKEYAGNISMLFLKKH